MDLVSDELFTLVYDELRRLAARRIAPAEGALTLQATALVHEAWLRLRGPAEPRWRNRAHFFGAAAQAMRRILIEDARRKASARRGGHLRRVDFHGIDIPDTTADENLLRIHEALSELEAEDPGKANIVALKFFAGFSNQEVAACLETTERTVERHWAFARAWLFQRIRPAPAGVPAR